MIKHINWPRELFAGVYSSFLVICFTQAAVVLIFTGPLSPLLPLGLATGFLGVTIVNFFYGLSSRFPYSLATTSPSLGAIVILMTANISKSTSPENFLPTALVALVIVTICTGLMMLISGMTGLVRLLRYMPYPVIGGFMAVTGYMLLVGSVQVMSQDLPQPTNLISTLAISWMGITYGALLFIAIKIINSKYVYMIVILGTILLINSYLFVKGITHDEAVAGGYFLSGMHISLMTNDWDIQYIAHIDWRAITSNINYYLVVSVTAILIQTFRLSALESTTVSRKLLDTEIASCGIGVFISGLVGGVLTTPSVPVSVLLQRIGVKTVIPLLMTILVVLVMMIGVPDILSYMPKAILVGLIIFSALELFYEWLYQAFWRLPYEDYLLILSIFLTAIFFGFMMSILLGVLLASTFFLVKYSRINNVKYEITGKEFRSKHKYPYSVEQYLRRVGKRTLILKLQGYLFFGSSRRLLEHVYYTLKDVRMGHYVNLILDFQHVTGLDVSSVVNFITLGEIAKKYQVQYLISNAKKDIKEQFIHMSSRQWLDQNILFMPSLDYALEWCESRYLIGADTEGDEDLNLLFNKSQDQDIFLEYLLRKDVRAGTYLFRQGEPSDSLYFLQKGQVTAFINAANNQTIRLFTTESNVLLGEMGFFSGHPRSATIVTDTSCTLFELTIPILNKIEEEHPELIIEFYESVIQLLSDRINELNVDLELFQR